MVNVNITGELPEGLSVQSIEKVVSLICKTEAPETSYDISLLLVDSKTMREYNRKFRGVNSSTDILCFEGARIPFFCDSKTIEMRMCDIIIDINQVDRQKGKNTITEELWHVLVHGILHLVGYDHIKTIDRQKMEEAEENYNNLLKDGLSV
jgi:probable rRNA maturation factor